VVSEHSSNKLPPGNDQRPVSRNKRYDGRQGNILDLKVRFMMLERAKTTDAQETSKS
jgi:hypothetical protein